MALSYVYTKKRCEFGRQIQFAIGKTDMCDSIGVNKVEHKQYILRNPVHELTQHTPRFSQCEINTIRAEYANSGANHAEGGWPKDVHVHDPEATQRYRRKIEKDDAYIHCVMNLSPGLEKLVLQNNAIEMYQTYYAELANMPAVEQNSCRTVNVYRDGAGASKRERSGSASSGPCRPVSSICWLPDGGSRFAATYVDIDFNRETRAPLDAYIWDVDSANSPETTISPECPLLDLQYNPKDSHMLAGGLMNGGVAAWDLRMKANKPTAASPPHVAHRDLVRNVLFINSKSGLEFFSGGPDGVVKWWDIRKIDEPTDELIIDLVKTQTEVQSMAKSNGVSVLEYESTLPTRFMVGTENGLVINGNRKGKSAMDKLPAKFDAHVGPVWRVERNPGFLKNFLTVGDWTARVWSEECRESSVIWTPPARHRITNGSWSPTRVSLMLLTQYDGNLSVWDLLRRQHEPVLTMQVCEEPLLTVRPHDGGALLTCGSHKGNIYLVELSQNLAMSDKNDKHLLTAVFERESKRERILEARMREIKLKQRQAEGSPVHSASEMEATLGDRDLLEAAQEFMQITRKEFAAL
ncbi:dynein intermediate chain 3, ciliary [Spodoptera frugiperda]|uniref:Dynein intermediate chain 3, ciliary n=1 Tax=Spodoptera frugiperda TaxID=7108 RepID=A0A2H1V4H2_SPOFR|nr:dynein intermediate chain 3, ciliary [Spodoptera frugiperda]